jgi:hypothetical protein
MSNQASDDPQALIKALRDQVARLITENLELRRQLEDLRRVKTDAPIANLAVSALNSIRSAEQTLADLAGDGPRYIISELEAEFKGVIAPQELAAQGTTSTGPALAFRVPLPEYGSAPGHLGSVRMTFEHIPPPLTK